MVPKKELDTLAARCDAEQAALRDSLRGRNDALQVQSGQLFLLEEELAVLRGRAAQLQGDLAVLHGDDQMHAADAARLDAALRLVEQRRVAAEAAVADYRDLLGRFARLIDAGQLRVRMDAGRMVVELPMDVLFASGAASLSVAGDAALREVGVVLATMPDRSFQVAGHTDDVPIHTRRFPSNWELAAARSITVVRTLSGVGVAKERLSAASYAEFLPTATNTTEEGRGANRRIEIVLVPDLTGLPGYAELAAVDLGRP
jgi:chemotaxis protein MotB